MKTLVKLIVLIITGSFCLACAPTNIERDYGTSYKLSKYNQILDQNAEKNLKPVEGLPGNAAGAVMDNYQKGFEKPEPLPSSITGYGTKDAKD